MPSAEPSARLSQIVGHFCWGLSIASHLTHFKGRFPIMADWTSRPWLPVMSSSLASFFFYRHLVSLHFSPDVHVYFLHSVVLSFSDSQPIPLLPLQLFKTTFCQGYPSLSSFPCFIFPCASSLTIVLSFIYFLSSTRL